MTKIFSIGADVAFTILLLLSAVMLGCDGLRMNPHPCKCIHHTPIVYTLVTCMVKIMSHPRFDMFECTFPRLKSQVVFVF